MSQHKFRSVASLFAVALLAAACPVGPNNRARTLGGTVTNLKGTGLVLQFNGGDDLTIDPGATTFKFDSYTVDTWSYEVTVLTQPTNPSQTCKVENGSGTTDGADVTSVEVICTTNTYTVGVSVSRLLGNGAGLVLQLNDGEELPVAVAGKFAFSSKVESGATYTVKVAQQPTNPAQTCSISDQSGTGTVGSADVTDVAVTCTIKNTYVIGGSVSGLLGIGAGLALQLNDGEKIDVVREGKFTFSGKLESGATYAVAVAKQPTNPAQTCSVSEGSGTVAAADVDSIVVDCLGNPFSVGFSVQGLAGSGLEVALNGAETLSVKNNGTFSFETKLVGAATYDVTVTKHPTNPSQTCSPVQGRGTGNGTDVAHILIVCSANAYTVGGKVKGLLGGNLVLRLNGQNPLTVSTNGDFIFPGKVASGAPYSITAETQQSTLACTITNASGTVANADVLDVLVSCSCASGLVPCSGQCVDPSKDNANCGRCGNECAAPTACLNSTCLCPAGKTLCPDGCVDMTTDPKNCGVCQSVCADGQACFASACKRYTWTNDVVTDHQTGRSWQRVAPSSKYDWLGAKDYCPQVMLGGFSDWRLPTLEELKTIVDTSKQDPAIDGDAFPNTPSSVFWTSTPDTSNSRYAWGVYFVTGGSYWGGTTGAYWVRCVR
jgi:hypothetical protein